MKNTKYLLSLLALVLLLAYNSCKCPECPQSNSIVTDNVDTLSFKIVTDNVDTLSFKIAVPVVKVDGKVEKASIVVDNVDMARLMMEKVDTSIFNIDIRPRPERQDKQEQNQ